MLETLVFGLVALAISPLSHFFGETAWIGQFITGAFGGALEEAVEGVIQSLIPNGRASEKKNRQIMLEKIVQYLKGLSPDELKELADFMRTVDLKGILSKSERKYGIDGFDLLFDGKIDIIDVKARKKAIKNLGKLFNAIFKEIDENKNRSIKFKSSLECVQSIAVDASGKNVTEVPESFVKVFDIINDYVYKIKYLTLSRDDKDIVNIIQYMVHEERTALFDDMKEYFDLMQQQPVAARNEKTGALNVVDIKTQARRDPFCFVRLVCPNCGATGRNIVRENDRAFCAKCGETYDIIRNVDDVEVKQAISEAETRIVLAIGEIKGAADGISAEVKELAAKTVSLEYFELFRAEIQSNAQATADSVALSIGKRIAEGRDLINAHITESLRPIKAELEALVKRGAAVNPGVVSECMRKGINALDGKMDTALREIAEVKQMIGELEEKITYTKQIPRSFKAKCPRCETESGFRSNGEYKKCTLCGFNVKSEALDGGNLADVNTSVLTLTDGILTAENVFDTAKLRLTHSVINAVTEGLSVSRAIKRKDGFAQLILTGTNGTKASSKIINTLACELNVTEIVIGGELGYERRGLNSNITVRSKN